MRRSLDVVLGTTHTISELQGGGGLDPLPPVWSPGEQVRVQGGVHGSFAAAAQAKPWLGVLAMGDVQADHGHGGSGARVGPNSDAQIAGSGPISVDVWCVFLCGSSSTTEGAGRQPVRAVRPTWAIQSPRSWSLKW